MTGDICKDHTYGTLGVGSKWDMMHFTSETRVFGVIRNENIRGKKAGEYQNDTNFEKKVIKMIRY